MAIAPSHQAENEPTINHGRLTVLDVRFAARVLPVLGRWNEPRRDWIHVDMVRKTQKTAFVPDHFGFVASTEEWTRPLQAPIEVPCIGLAYPFHESGNRMWLTLTHNQ
ncbi:hypothetical protein EHM92_07785 [bacterium]|nr:MAG: hypothetical protein EHM92_07785 [bacterium]